MQRCVNIICMGMLHVFGVRKGISILVNGDVHGLWVARILLSSLSVCCLLGVSVAFVWGGGRQQA